MRRTIASLCVAPLLAASIVTAAHAAPTMDQDGYAENVREYAKELVAAVFAVKWCTQYNLSLNNQYFNSKSPGVKWDQKTFDAFVEGTMIETRKKIDAMWASMGQESYCRTYIDFAKRNGTFVGTAVLIQPRK